MCTSTKSRISRLQMPVFFSQRTLPSLNLTLIIINDSTVFEIVVEPFLGEKIVQLKLNLVLIIGPY